MGETERKLEVLHKLAGRLNDSGVLWAVGASAMLYLRGAVKSFNDIDIMVCKEDAPKAEAVLMRMGRLLPSEAGGFATECFREFDIEGVEVDLIGGFKIVNGGRVYDCDLTPAGVDLAADLNGQSVPLHSAALWREYYLLMERPEKARVIEEFLNDPHNFTTKYINIKAQ